MSATEGTAGHLLQRLVLDADDDRRALYWRQTDASGAPLNTADGRTISPFCRLRLDTLVNSFFERYWRDLTRLETLALSVETSGPCHVRIVRRIMGQPEGTLAAVNAKGAHARSILAVPLHELSDSDAIIYAEIEAFDQTVVVHEGAWLTDTPARNEVRLSIVICSFGREAMLVKNLQRMAEVIARTAEIGALFIVRQGGGDLDAFEPYRQLAGITPFAEKLHLIRQDNFGGTGGFVRGILESLDEDATHVLLLDDDVRIEPAVLERLVTLTSRLHALATIGGQMLDLVRPTVLHASHELADFPNLRLHSPCKDVDLAAPHAIDMFGFRHASDYNAWWFCCIPASVFREIGLPAPMFIRHDDVEYGVRTIASGTPLVTMPGLFVWHAPFTAKNLTPSFFYYERRNFLIAAAMHKKVGPVRLMTRHWREAWAGLRRHRYEYCWAVCRAVDDFLAGPGVVFADMRERHRRLTEDQARFTLLTIANLRHRTEAHRRTSLTRLLLLPSRSRKTAEASFASTARHLAFTTVRTSLALLWRGRRAGAAYRAEAKNFTSAAFWRNLLALPSRPGTPP